MNNGEEITKLCQNLPYTKSRIISDDVCGATLDMLTSAFEKYGYGRVLGILAKIWSYEDAVAFGNKAFEKENAFSFGSEKKQIRSVASSYYRAYDGGVERVNASLMDIWTKMGIKITFFTEEPESPNDYEYPKSVNRIILSNNDICERLASLEFYANENQFDFFIEHQWNSQNVIWEILLMRFLGVKYAVYCHTHFSWFFSSGRSYLFQPDCFKLCDIVLAISETNARFYQMCGCKTYLLQNPVPNDLPLLNEPVDGKSKRILLVGRLAPEKFPMEALKIFGFVHDKVPDAKLDIVGDGELRSEMLEYVDKHNLKDSVVFHGFKSSGELDKYYREACCGLFTSKMEGYPMVVLESKAYGLPLVMYDMPYLSLLKDGKGFLSAPVGDCNKMADILIRILLDKNYRDKLGIDALESFRELKAHNYVSDWENIFNVICGYQIEDDENYYSQEKLSTPERNILPIFIDKLKTGFISELESNKDYRFGRAILKYPRAIRRLLRKLLGLIKE